MYKSVKEIREAFLNYFASKNHELVKSSPLVPHNDPSLLFTNAGMVQFKNYFTGVEKPKFTKAVTSQKCVRAGGKHNDLENVGYTARHHTFFEMLGNFSFGDYFKEDAIKFAYEFVTQELGLAREKLLVTIYHTDDEAAEIWRKVAGFSDDKIIRIDSSDNFWSMGDTGPCGPCSEIFYDHGEHIPGNKPGSGDEGDRFIEIWNLVFMQYETLADGTRIDLPNPAIDTGMGLERVAAILQGKHNNYDIDLFQKLIAAVKEQVGDKGDIASYRVIADHLRSASFLLADGVFPSNEGRGYVLRRIIRRAMRHAYHLGHKGPLLSKLFPVLQQEMAGHFSELKEAGEAINKLLLSEEERFGKTLERGMELLQEELSSLKNETIFSGAVAFKLYDTYGFPLDLTADILRSKNMSINVAEFDAKMQQQKERARENWCGSGSLKEEKIWFSLKDKLGVTEFVGYEEEVTEAKIIAILKDAAEVTEARQEDEFVLLCDKTVFYAESGGQVADTGFITTEEAEIEVIDVQKFADGLFAHFVKIKSGQIKLGDKATLVVAHERRKEIRANHSATHLLHAALRQVLGAHVTQKGSLVNADLLRFDFAHNQALSAEDIADIEHLVNEQIRNNQYVITSLMSIDDAKEDGAMMLFGEKYSEQVRVLAMGEFSKELCGGTHVNQLGDIAIFKIVSEGSISAGIRRIEAFTGHKAFTYLAQKASKLKEATDLLKVNDNELKNQLENLLLEKKNLQKQVTKFQSDMVLADLYKQHQQIAEHKILIANLQDIAAKDVRDIATNLAKKLDLVTIFAQNAEKISIIVTISKQAEAKNLNAVSLLKEIVTALGGKGGGGNNNFAQGGATNNGNLKEVKTNFAEKIAKLLA